MSKRRPKLDIFLRCKKCKRLTRHAMISSNKNSEERAVYQCQECGERRKLRSSNGMAALKKP